jgi:hypothetical protein
MIPAYSGTVGEKDFSVVRNNGLPNIKFGFHYVNHTKFIVGNGFTLACRNTV